MKSDQIHEFKKLGNLYRVVTDNRHFRLALAIVAFALFWVILGIASIGFTLFGMVGVVAIAVKSFFEVDGKKW